MKNGPDRNHPSTLRVVVTTLVALLILVVLGASLFIRSGAYPIAATEDHLPVEVWVFETLRDRSVARHARDVSVPADLDDRDRLLMGAVQYEGMCAACHGSPGEALGAMAEGLLPRPPRFDEELRLTAAEQFWITREGLRFTGMPAWGPTHHEDELWAVVALLRVMPDLSQEQYQALLAEAVEAGHTHDHDHDHDHGDHEHAEEHGEQDAHGDGHDHHDH